MTTIHIKGGAAPRSCVLGNRPRTVRTDGYSHLRDGDLLHLRRIARDCRASGTRCGRRIFIFEGMPTKPHPCRILSTPQPRSPALRIRAAQLERSPGGRLPPNPSMARTALRCRRANDGGAMYHLVRRQDRAGQPMDRAQQGVQWHNETPCRRCCAAVKQFRKGQGALSPAGAPVARVP